MASVRSRMLPSATCRLMLASVVKSSAQEPFQVPVQMPVRRGGRTPGRYSRGHLGGEDEAGQGRGAGGEGGRGEESPTVEGKVGQ